MTRPAALPTLPRWLHLALLLLLCATPLAHAIEIAKVSSTVLEDSEEPFSRRIYSYDIDVDSAGNLHLIYAKPVPGHDRCEIIYATGPSPTNLVKTLLETDGKLGSVTTELLVTGINFVHVCYVKHQNDPDTHLVHQTIQNGVPSEQHFVDHGGWHTKMQMMWPKPIFVREAENSLSFVSPIIDVPNTWRAYPFAPSGNHPYRLADFVFDPEPIRFHVTYGDHANSHNGAPLHNLRYAHSDYSRQWTSETIDSNTSLWEMEFWTSLVLDPAGNPILSTYRYAEHGGAYNTGTSLLLARQNGTNWHKQTIAGVIPGQTPPDHRAGMGGQLHVDDAGILYGAWDNSPDYPIDFDGQYGNVVMDHSVDGGPWQSKTQIEPFSAEGYCRLASLRTNLYVLVLGNYADAKLYLIQLESRRQWWRTATDMRNGWRWTKDFGYFNVASDPWIYHADLGWLYGTGISPSSLWFWTADLGWLWTRSSIYPYLWSQNRNAWLWYNGSKNPRWFRDMQSGEWLSLP